MNNFNLSKKQRLVYEVIKANQGVQNNDADLIAAVWRYEGWNEYKSLEYNLSRMTRPETITRRRRELFNMGLIEYSETSLKDRSEAFDNERNNNNHAMSWLND